MTGKIKRKIGTIGPPNSGIATEFYTIAVVATIYGTTLRALRFYEQQGLLSPARVTGQRLYSVKDRLRLGIILKGKQLGFTLKEIKKFLPGASAANSVDELRPPADLLSILDREQIEHQIEILQSERGQLQISIDELQEASRPTDTS